MEIRGTLGDRAGLGPLKQALHAYALRHRVIASNIANAEVEGYIPKKVTFEDAAQRALGKIPGIRGYTTDPGHIPLGNVEPSAVEPEVETQSPAAGEGEGVDLEKEMVSLAENQLSYRLVVRLLDMKYNTLSKAIRGSSR